MFIRNAQLCKEIGKIRIIKKGGKNVLPYCHFPPLYPRRYITYSESPLSRLMRSRSRLDRRELDFDLERLKRNIDHISRL